MVESCHFGASMGQPNLGPEIVIGPDMGPGRDQNSTRTQNRLENPKICGKKCPDWLEET